MLLSSSRVAPLYVAVLIFIFCPQQQIYVEAACSGSCTSFDDPACYTDNAHPCECVCSVSGQCVPNRLPPAACEDKCGSSECTLLQPLVDTVCEDPQATCPPSGVGAAEQGCCPDACQVRTCTFQDPSPDTCNIQTKCRAIDQCCIGRAGGCTLATITPSQSATSTISASAAPVCGLCPECGSFCDGDIDNFYCGNSIQQCSCACQSFKCRDNEAQNKIGLFCSIDAECTSVCPGCASIHCNPDIGCCECYDCPSLTPTPTPTPAPPSVSGTATSSRSATPSTSVSASLTAIASASTSSTPTTQPSASGGGGAAGGDVSIDITVLHGTADAEEDIDNSELYWILAGLITFAIAACLILGFLYYLYFVPRRVVAVQRRVRRHF